MSDEFEKWWGGADAFLIRRGLGDMGLLHIESCEKFIEFIHMAFRAGYAEGLNDGCQLAAKVEIK